MKSKLTGLLDKGKSKTLMPKQLIIKNQAGKDRNISQIDMASNF